MTLFELIIVAALVAVLSGFFFLSTRHLVVRTKLSRVKEEHRVLSRALQNYQMDYMDFPNNVQGLQVLNNPTAYLASLPRDPFSAHANKVYYYRQDPGGGYSYIIVSAGPDGDVDFLNYLAEARTIVSAAPSEDDTSAQAKIDALFQEYLTTKAYDPTNGLNSQGDVITLSTK